MRVLLDPSGALGSGLAAIRRQFDVPAGFPAEVEAAARDAASRAADGHVDRTDLPFVTLDPAGSRDLDQAFHLSTEGDDVVLHYAIADVGWFVAHGDALDAEAWRRGTTQYLPDGRAPLYPAAVSEGAASLLPDGPRPAVVFRVRLGDGADPVLDGVERAMVRSRAQLAYESVTDADLPAGLAEFARRMADRDERHGATRVDPPEQEVRRIDGDGRYELAYRPRRDVEDQNATLSLATNLAVGAALLGAGTGLYRVMPPPDDRAVRRLRHTARALGVEWGDGESLRELERRLDPTVPADAALMLAVRRAGGGASYAPFEHGVVPWHAAIAGTYVHATAPLRRLADRYVVEAALAVAAGREVPEAVAVAFAELPPVMARAANAAGQIDRAVVDLAEAVVLHDRVGRTFRAVVTDEDERGPRIQLCDVPVVARVQARGVQPGDEVRVKLVAADPAARRVEFSRVA